MAVDAEPEPEPEPASGSESGSDSEGVTDDRDDRGDGDADADADATTGAGDAGRDPDPAPGGDGTGDDTGAVGAGPDDPFAAYAAEPVPQAPVGAPGKDGRLELAFAPDDRGRTRLVHDLARVPFHVSGTLDHDPHPDGTVVYVQSPSGGVTQGDRHDVRVAAHPDAVAHVTTASATKVQSMDANCAESATTLTVGRGAHLEHVPGPTILHADARYRETTTVEVAPGGSAVVGGTVVPGRLARGERFAFERYHARLRVRGPDGLVVEDATRLAPGADGDGDGDADRPGPTAPGVLGDLPVHGSRFVVAPGLDEAAATALADACHAAAVDGEARAGATRLPTAAGVGVRAAGDRAAAVTAALDRAHAVARRELIGADLVPGRR